nr:hypothetical protein P5658_16720 [Bacillus subtilis]
MVIIVNNEADKLKKLVPDTRSVFSIMIERSENAVFSVEEVRGVAGLTQNEFYHHYKMLNKYYFIDEVEVLDGDYISSDGLLLWTDIKNFCDSGSNSVTVNVIINDLNFSLLD